MAVDSSFQQSARLHHDMLELERHVAIAHPFRPPVLGGDNPTLRDRLLRAGAAWLIGWSGILAALKWLPRLRG